MAAATLDKSTIKQVLKEALLEALQEQRELFHDIFVEALEDFALVEAIREGQATKPATREEVMSVLKGKR
jgi:hypothetical protein